jgi:hypothetical protein
MPEIDSLELPQLAILYLLLYPSKVAVSARVSGRWRSLFCHGALILCGIAYVYLFVEQWNAIDVEPMGHWIGGPLIALTVPAVSSAIDVVRPRRSVRLLIARSFFELACLPIWYWIAVCLNFMAGWVNL